MPILKPGSIIGGYEIIEFHRKGGMGEVYRAKQISVDREVALKLLLPERARSDPAFAKRFIDEARAAGNLSHPGIIAVHDVARVKLTGSDEHLYFFTMEFVQGEDLKIQTRAQGRLPLETIGTVMMVMADVLDYAQKKGVIHRDIKPENILLTKDGHPKLADFGICAKETETDDGEGVEKPEHRVVMGTPAYMSPEQARAQVLDWRSDQYSLGATLFFVLTGEMPFRGANSRELMRAHVTAPIPDPRSLVSEIPARWAELCLRMMAKNPDDRFQTAADIAEAVQAALSGQDAPRKRNVPSTASRPTASSQTLWIPAAGIAAAAVLGLVGFLVFRPPSNETNPNNSASHQDDSLDQEQRLKMAEALIRNLDSDPVKAEAKLSGPDGLGSPYYAKTPKALSVMQAKRDGLRQVIAANRQKQKEVLLERLNRIKDILAQHKLQEARALAQSFTAEDRRLVELELYDLNKGIAEESTAQTNAIIKTIAACSLEELSSNNPEKYQQILNEADLKRLQEAIKQRREQLEALAKKQREAEMAKALALGQRVQNLYVKTLELQGLSGLDPAILIEECRSLVPTLNPEQKDAVKQVETLAQAVQKNQERLDQYLSKTGVIVIFDGRSLRPLKHQNRTLFFDVQHKNPIPLSDPRLDMMNIISGTLEGVAKAEMGTQAAVLLWSLGSNLWMPLANARERENDPLCKLLLQLDALALRRALSEPRPSILNLSAEAPRFLSIFQGDGLASILSNKKPTLRWTTEASRQNVTAPHLLPGIVLPFQRPSIAQLSLRFRPLSQSQCMVVIDVPKGLCMAIAIDGRGQRLAAGSAIQPAPVQMKPQLPPPGSILDAEHCAVITQSGDTWKLSFDGKTLCECKAPATGTFALRFATFQTTGVSGADLIELRVE